MAGAASAPARSESSEPVRAIASIAPLHSLLASLMLEAGEPLLLVPAAQSPHNYMLRPSQAEALSRVQLVLWVGPALEGFLANALEDDDEGARIVAALALEGLTLHSATEEPFHHDDDHGGATDPHLWLDPANARIIAAAARDALSLLDPARSALYARNADALFARLDALDRRIRAMLEPVRGVRYLVFHNAFRYFEHRYALAGGTAITPDPTQMPGMRRAATVRESLERGEIACVFSEPQFPAAVIERLIAGTPARRGELDPLGSTLAPGPDAYVELLEGLAAEFARCLGPVP